MQLQKFNYTLLIIKKNNGIFIKWDKKKSPDPIVEISALKIHEYHTQRNELIKTRKTCFVEYIFDVLSKIFSWSKITVL